MNPSVKVAQPGWNATTAPDWALVFNSDWPSLQIAFEQTFTFNANQAISISVDHNLGYVPIAMAWITVNGLNYGRVSELETNATKVFFFGPTISEPTIVTIRCFAVDTTKEASYPLPSSAAAKTAPDISTFIKIAKPNRSITSPNLNDFILNSVAQSPAILNVATQAGKYFHNNNPYGTAPLSIQYPLQTSYIPWVIGAIGLGGGDYVYYTPDALLYEQSTNTLVFQYGAAGPDASLIVMRDPLFYPNTVRVVY